MAAKRVRYRDMALRICDLLTICGRLAATLRSAYFQCVQSSGIMEGAFDSIYFKLEGEKTNRMNRKISTDTFRIQRYRCGHDSNRMCYLRNERVHLKYASE